MGSAFLILGWREKNPGYNLLPLLILRPSGVSLCILCRAGNLPPVSLSCPPVIARWQGCLHVPAEQLSWTRSHEDLWVCLCSDIKSSLEFRSCSLLESALWWWSADCGLGF